MKNIMLILIILFLGVSFSSFTLAQEEKQEKKEKTETPSAKVESTKPVNTICPVSTEEADAEFTYTYEGKTYAVCCNSCLKKFKKDPEKYISRLSEDGKSIKKNKGDKK